MNLVLSLALLTLFFINTLGEVTPDPSLLNLSPPIQSPVEETPYKNPPDEQVWHIDDNTEENFEAETEALSSSVDVELIIDDEVDVPDD